MNDTWRVSTGDLPEPDEIRRLMDEAHERFRSVDDGDGRRLHPGAGRGRSGRCSAPAIVGVPAQIVLGRRRRPSRSRSRACPSRSCSRSCARRSAHEAAREQLGVNSTGLPFNSVMAVELNERPHDEPDGQRRRDRHHEPGPGRHGRGEVGSTSATGCRASPGASSTLDEDVYASESATNQRNQGIAHLLDSYGRDVLRSGRGHRRLHPAVLAAGERRGPAVMGATLADGGVNPHDRRAGGRRSALRAGARGARDRRASTSAPASGCTRSACPARAASAAGSSRSRPARVGSARSRRRSTRPATACAASCSRSTCPNAWASTSSCRRPPADRSVRLR